MATSSSAREASKWLGPLLALAIVAWIVELVGLYFVQKSCNDHSHDANHTWATGAQLPDTNSCSRTYRYLWWSIWYEFPIAIGLLASLLGWLGSGYNILRRFRSAFIGLLAASLALHFWATNVTLNLTDTFSAHKYETDTERLRARVTWIGFAVSSALQAALILALGDEDAYAYDPYPYGVGVREPLVAEDVGLRAPLSTV
eukprot:jgi/Botrbrau1/4311/Bobra.0232s0003.1